MKESKAYLLFFQKNLSYFLIGSLLFATLGILVQLQKPTQYNSSMVLEMDSPSETITNKISLVQEAVSLVRSQNIQSSIGVNSKLTVFNNSPLTITIESSARDKSSTLQDLERIKIFLNAKFSLTQIGMVLTSSIYPNLILGGVIGLGIGNLLVVSVLLVRLYVKHF